MIMFWLFIKIYVTVSEAVLCITQHSSLEIVGCSKLAELPRTFVVSCWQMHACETLKLTNFPHTQSIKCYFMEESKYYQCLPN